jgi:hypothetical protein
MAGEGDAERLVVLLEARIRDFENNLKKASGTATRSFGDMRRASQSATRQMEQDVIRSSARINQAMGSVSSIFGSFGKGLIAGAASAVTITALTQIAEKVRAIVAEGAGLVDTANKVGMTTESLQELHFAATQGGASIDQMDTALSFFAKSLGEASQGSGDLYKVLKANNVSLRDQDGAMRPVIDLVRDYANLIKNASSEQERARLTTLAFGRSGGDLANVFRDGAAGIDQTTDALVKMGGVIDDATLQKIASIDDRWDAFATTLDTHVKGAVLETVARLDTLAGKLQALGKGLSDFEFGRGTAAQQNGALAGAMIDPQAGAKEQLRQGLQGGSSFDWSGKDSWLGAAGPTTKLPPPDAGRDVAADRLDRERKAVDELIASLKEENGLIGASAEDQDVANNLRQAGAAATEDQRKAIEEWTRKNYEAKESLDAINRAEGFFADQAYNAIDGLLVQGDSLADTFRNVAKAVAEAALQAELLGDGPLAGLFGTGSKTGGTGGLLGTLFSAIGLGARAEGGPVSSGSPYMVGERGPEIIVPGQSGTVIPNHKLPTAAAPAAPTIHLHVTNDFRGADAATVARISASQAPQIVAAATKAAVNQVRESIRVRGTV